MEGYAEVKFQDGTIISFSVPKMTCEENSLIYFNDELKFESNEGYSANLTIERF